MVPDASAGGSGVYVHGGVPARRSVGLEIDCFLAQKTIPPPRPPTHTQHVPKISVLLPKRNTLDAGGGGEALTGGGGGGEESSTV